MKHIIVITLLLICVPAQANLDPREVAIRDARLYYGLGDGGEAWLRAVCQIENGSKGKRCGHMNGKRDRQVFANPCLGEDSFDEARTTRALIRAMQVYIFDKNEWTTLDFGRFYAGWYHAGGGGETPEKQAANNKQYRNDLMDTYRKMRRHIEFRNRTTKYDPTQALNEKEFEHG